MSKTDYESYLERIPYDAMGDFSMFREEKHKESQTDSEKASQQK